MGPRHDRTHAEEQGGRGLAFIGAMFYLDAWAAEAALRLPAWVREVFNEITDFGKSGWFLWPTGILLLAIAFLVSPASAPIDRALLAIVGLRVGFLFSAIALPSLVVTIIKRIIGRARPLVGDGIDPFVFKQWVWRPEYASLPSGHATTAFATAIAISALWPKLRVPMLVYAFLIALSRVVVGAHYPSDVLAGAIAGTVGALLLRDWFAERRLVFSVGHKGSVTVMPGPSAARIKTVARRLFAA
jgi:membrane-associated phospholipid phosphatase